jgi:AcrR family transcriptional regulator
VSLGEVLARNRRNADDAAELGATGPLEAEGMRERKKRERRDAISACALRLFAENGFERVSMREIAHAADVSEPTVFNYFPTKENLVFNEDRERELALLRAVRDRPPGTSVVAAFRDMALVLLDRHRRETDMDWFRVVQGSPTLQRYRRELYARQGLSLAGVLKTQAGGRLGDVAALSAARALMGVMAAAGETFGQRLLSGASPKSVAREVRADVVRAFDLFETGL